MCLLGMVAGRASLVCLLVGVLAWRAGLVGLVPKQSRDPNVSAHFRVAARICLGSVLGRHDRDPNMSTHIRIAAVLWDETIKSVCAQSGSAAFCPIGVCGIVPHRGRRYVAQSG